MIYNPSFLPKLHKSLHDTRNTLIEQDFEATLHKIPPQNCRSKTRARTASKNCERSLVHQGIFFLYLCNWRRGLQESVPYAPSKNEGQ